MTVDEILNKDMIWDKFASRYPETATSVEKALIEFAQYHVEQALLQASKSAKIIPDPNSYVGNTESEYPANDIVSKDSILSAYPKELIK